ncbi:MAG: hypothetical protein HFG20_09410, partial [Anaerotruncus sp.]|nr:hypothetical protein [Anaerotruncus sp.]
MKNRVLPLVLALSLVGTTSLSTYAAEPTENTMKDENIYTNLHYDGSVDQVYVVNQFNLASAGTITDYGDYTKTKNMTTLEEITVQQGKTSIQAPAGKFYYQGYLDTKEIPWLVEIHYYLDGKELPGEQLAGKSGALKITLSTRPNPAVNPVYFANFALQISASFDNENCENLSAYDAGSNSKGTVVNVGGQKQVNFIALPDKEKDYVITADVRNFEMDGIKLNGMALSIAIDDPDISSLLNDIYTLQDAAFSLDDAALSMQGGVNDLDDAAEKINDGTRDLKNGVEDANTGAKTLDKAVHTAAGSSELEDAMKEFGSQLEQFGKLLGNQSVVQKDEILVQEDGDTITRTAAATTEEDKSADSPAEQPPVEPAPPAEQPPVEPAPPAEQPPVEPVPPAEQPPVEPVPPAEQP